MTDNPKWRYEPVMPPTFIDGEMSKQDLEAHARFYGEIYDRNNDAVRSAFGVGDLTGEQAFEEYAANNSGFVSKLRSLVNEYIYGVCSPHVLLEDTKESN